MSRPSIDRAMIGPMTRAVRQAVTRAPASMALSAATFGRAAPAARTGAPLRPLTAFNGAATQSPRRVATAIAAPAVPATADVSSEIQDLEHAPAYPAAPIDETHPLAPPTATPAERNRTDDDTAPRALEPGADAPAVITPGDIALRRWRSRVRAYVGTHHVHVELQTLTRSLRWRTVRAARLAIRQPGALDLVAALDTMAETLQNLRATTDGATGRDFGRAACDVILADAWLVYDVVEIDLATLPPALAHQGVAAALADIAGTAADVLAVRWQRRRDGRGAFGMAIAADHIACLRRVLAAHRLRLAAVTGELVAVLNARRSLLPASRAVVAIARESGTQIAALIDGDIAVTQFEPGQVDATVLPRAALRALRARGVDAAATTDYCIDAGGHAGTEFAPGWRVLPSPPWVPALSPTL